jgi:hypothetical protein
MVRLISSCLMACICVLSVADNSHGQILQRLRNARLGAQCGGAAAAQCSGSAAKAQCGGTAMSCAGSASQVRFGAEVYNNANIALQEECLTCKVASGLSVSNSVGVQGSVETQGLGDRVIFRRALMRAAGNAQRDGRITIEEYFSIARSSRNPAKLAELQESIQETAVQQGLASATAIDWDGLIAFIEKLLPIILKLIDLFGYNPGDIQGLVFNDSGVTVTMTDGFVLVLAA